MGLLKKLGLKKKKSKQQKDVGVTTTEDVRGKAATAAAPKSDAAPTRPDSPEPENDFAAALRQKSMNLRHFELTITPPAQDQSGVQTADGDEEEDDEGEIEIGEVDLEEEEESNEFLLAIRQKALQTKHITQEKEVSKPAEPAPKETKKLADDRVAQMFAKQKQEDESRAKNRADARVAEMFTKQKQNQADARVAEMFNKQNQNDSSRIEKDFGYTPHQKKGTADERVAKMFAKSKQTNDSKPNTVGAHKLDAEERLAEIRLSSKSQPDCTKMDEKIGPAVRKASDQKKIVEALLQKQHDPKGFIDSKKGSTKVEIPTAYSTQSTAPGIEKNVGLSFAERRKMAEAMSQRKVVTNESKHMVDVSHENFGNRNSFAQRRKMLEAKSQGQKALIMGSPTNGVQSNPQQGGSLETKMKKETGPSNESSDVDLSELQQQSSDVQEGEKGGENVVNQGNVEASDKSSIDDVKSSRGPSRLSMAVAKAAAAKKQAQS